MSHNQATRRPLYDHELKLQPPHFQDMLERMLGAADGQRDKLTDVSEPVTSSYYLAPSVEVLDRIVAG